MSVEEIPDVILHPPEKYDRIRNRHGCCGLKPNLYYGGSVHRIWVMHAVRGAKAQGVGGYVDAYIRGHDREEKEEMREAVEQALAFYHEYRTLFDEEVKRREREREKRKEMQDDPDID